MDKNSIIGLILMGIVIVIFTWLGRPSEEEIALQKRYNDSIAAVTAAEAEKVRLAESEAKDRPTSPAFLSDSTLTQAQKDSMFLVESRKEYGEMAEAATGTEETVTLSNDSVSFTFSSKGARLVSTELLKHRDYKGEPIRLIRPGEAKMGFTFITKTNRVINTGDLYFRAEKTGQNQVRFSAPASNGGTLDILYTLRDKYRVDMEVSGTGDFASVLAPNASYLDAAVEIPIYQNEKSESSEQRYSGFAYQYTGGGSVEKMNTGKSDTVETGTPLQWIAFRDMFFSTIFYADKGLEGVSMNQEVLKDKGTGRIKNMDAKFILPIEGTAPVKLTIYSGPNDYALLHKIDKELDNGTSLGHVVDMGSWFRFITVWLIVPLFNFLEKYLTNYGVIILIMTVLIKLILSPFTWKTFKSQAKMRVLKPMVDEINAKYPGDDQMMERQKKTMELYSSAGVNTMGGCLPMLLQMPFLIAMYQYFPTSINLRGESFLWVKDLSTYDDVINWGFNIPFIGDHLALFCLLMTVTQVVYMQITQAMSGAADPSQKKLMLFMTIFMSIMLFTFLNDNAAALSYYYLLSMLISIIQTQAFKWAIDEDKVLAELKENQKKPKKKKSKWMQRLEEAQKLQEQKLKEQQRKK